MATNAAWSIGLGIDQLATAESGITAFLTEQGVGGRGAYVSQLIVEEIVSNLIRHASPGARHAEVTITIVVSPHAVTVVIEDDTPPFAPDLGPELDVNAPLEDRRTGGMGLHLVRAMAAELRYEQVGGRNRLTAVVVRA